jgi:hypothetical protein
MGTAKKTGSEGSGKRGFEDGKTVAACIDDNEYVRMRERGGLVPRKEES